MFGTYRVFFPGDSPSGLDLLVSMLILYIGWTMFTLAHTAWSSELSTSYDTRSRIMGTVHFFSLLGTIVVLLLPFALDQIAADVTMTDRAGIMGLFILVTLPLFTGIALVSTSEPPRINETPLAWREALTSLLENKPLRRLLLADLLLGMQAGINGAVHFFFIGQVLAMPEHASTYLLVLFASGLACIPIFVRLSYRIGKHQALCVSTLMTSIGTTSFFFLPAEQFWMTFFIYILVGISIGSKDFLMRSIMADVIDQDKVKTGVDRSALYYSMLTLTAKIGLAASVGILYPMLDWVGFDPNGENTSSTLTGVRIVVATSPTLLLFLVAVVMFRFPLGRSQQEELRRQL
jgi:Na+/melibiose symporter-like transporter